jgi:hypothetical protein
LKILNGEGLNMGRNGAAGKPDFRRWQRCGRLRSSLLPGMQQPLKLAVS